MATHLRLANMRLNPQQQKIYAYLRDNGEATIVQLRNALFIAKPDMRISEMNLMSRKESGEDLIVTVRKKENKEHVKALKRVLTKKVSHFEIVDNVAVEHVEEVAI